MLVLCVEDSGKDSPVSWLHTGCYHCQYSQNGISRDCRTWASKYGQELFPFHLKATICFTGIQSCADFLEIVLQAVHSFNEDWLRMRHRAWCWRASQWTENCIAVWHVENGSKGDNHNLQRQRLEWIQRSAVQRVRQNQGQIPTLQCFPVGPSVMLGNSQLQPPGQCHENIFFIDLRDQWENICKRPSTVPNT